MTARFFFTTILLCALMATGGCYTLIKQPGGQQQVTTAVRPVPAEFNAETLFQSTTVLPWTEVGFARTVTRASELLSRVRPDSASTALAMKTDFIRHMLVVITWGVSPPGQVSIEAVTVSGGKVHVFVRADYPDFRANRPPPSTVQSPVVVARMPLYDGHIIMHMAPRYAWSEAQRLWVQAPAQWSALGDVENMRVSFEEWSAAETLDSRDPVLD